MSYILDALRKADAERERDPARGIHAQPAAGVPLRSAPRRALWLWPVGCAVAAAVAAYGFWGRAPAGVASPAQPTIASAPVAAPVPALTMRVPPAPAIVTVATSVTPPPPTPVEHMAARAVVAPRVPAAPAPAQAKPAPAAPVAAVVAPAAPVAVIAAPAAPAASAPAASDRIFARTELPPDVQHALPKLAVAGGVYSENAAQRMLIVGGDVKSEGQELAPGVLLEQIRPHSAVLRFRGYRYSVAY